MDWAERSVLCRLRGMTPEEFRALPDCGEGLEFRLCAAAAEAESLEDFYRRAKTRRYSHARLRRLALWAWAGFTAADRPERVPYLRVLGATPRGIALLREMKEKAHLPILTKPAAGKALAPEGRRVLEWEARATDLWGLCVPRIVPAGAEWRQSPVILEQ